ncbi:MAG: AMP-binding protein [Pseudomonadota bacterium]
MFRLSLALVRNAAQVPRAPAMLGDQGTGGEDWVTHTDRVARLAGGLATKGLQPGDRIAILARNSPAQARIFHACYWSGVLPAPINWRLSPGEIAAQIEDCAPALIVADDAFAPHLPTAWQNRTLGWPEVEEMAGGAPIPAAELGPDDPALLVYTGGTTGRAKGVALSHGNIVANAFQVMEDMAFARDSRFLHVAPMFHSADLLGTGVTLLGGAHGFLADFSPDGFVAAVDDQGITHTMLPPTAIRFILEAGRAPTGGTLRRLIYGSSAMNPEEIARACRHFAGVGLLQGYGLTETAPLLTILGAEEHARIAAGEDALAQSAGRALTGVELKLADGGEVLARGPNVARGYWSAEAPADSPADGWFRTGDIGRLDEAGYLYLLGRSKDVIVTGGENVYAVEVERVLLDHPQLSDAAVVGLPDPTWGEVVTAAVVLSGAEFDEQDVLRHCRARLGGFKVPKRFHAVEALPRSALGKVLKQELRAALGDGR